MRRNAGGVRPVAVPINEPYLGTHLAPIVSAGVHPVNVFTPADVRAGDPSYFLDARYATVWRPHLRRLVLERLAAQAELAAREHGLARPVVVVKEPNGSQAGPLLGAILPGSRLLFLVRDGRDVLDSLLDAMSPGGWLSRGPDAASVASADGRIDFLRRNAALWAHRIGAVQLALAAHSPELTMTVRYEDLRSDPAATLRKIASWLRLDLGETAVAGATAATSFDAYPAEQKGRGKALRFASPGHWREGMSEAEQEAVVGIMGDKLRELGYEA